jgi:zinc protease
MLNELTRITTAPVSAEELSMGKDAFIYSMPSDFETSLSTVSSLGNIYLYDLGLDYYAKLPAEVSAVTPDDVLASAKRYLGPNDAIVVVVGDRAKIMPGLTALRLGAVELRKPDGSVAGGK